MTPPATRTSAATRERLLAAAAAVVRREGARGLTLDAVARQAGVSKGGLLYHFPGKRELVRGLVADWMDRFEAEVDAEAAPGGTGGWTRAYLHASDMTRVAPGERDVQQAQDCEDQHASCHGCDPSNAREVYAMAEAAAYCRV